MADACDCCGRCVGFLLDSFPLVAQPLNRGLAMAVLKKFPGELDNRAIEEEPPSQEAFHV